MQCLIVHYSAHLRAELNKITEMFLILKWALEHFAGIHCKNFVQYILILFSKNVYVFVNMSKNLNLKIIMLTLLNCW